jgi:hypothetical protein
MRSEHSWSLLDPRPVLVYLSTVDEYIVYWNGITMTHRHIYPKRNFQSELDRNLQFSGMEIIDDKWLHVVNFSNWAPANQSIKSIDSVRSKIKSLEAKI